MRIVSMKKNKGTIEIETERRFYIIDFLNDKILSNGQEIKKLSRDFFKLVMTIMNTLSVVRVLEHKRFYRNLFI